jgi:hypothetical protein
MIFAVSFDVELVQTFEWNDAVYDQLVLPPAQKKLIRALVQSHNNKTANFDDFVKGKGKGLVIKCVLASYLFLPLLILRSIAYLDPPESGKR